MNAPDVMSHRLNGGARLLRGWLTAVVTTMLAALGHQAAHSIAHPGHEEPLSPTLLILATVLAAPLCVGFAGKRLSRINTLVSVSASQLIFHGLYSLSQSAGHVHAVTAPGHEHHVVGLTLDTAAPVAGDHFADQVMIAAHLIAALMTTGVILYGEKTIFAVASQTLMPQPRRILSFVFHVPARLEIFPVVFTDWVPHSLFTPDVFKTRGPPVAGIGPKVSN